MVTSLQFILYFGVAVTVSAGRLKDCGDFGCYVEPRTGNTRWMAEFADFIDKNLIRDDDWEETTMKELREKVEFNLYVTKDKHETCLIGNEWLFEAFRKTKPTKIIIHGWQNDHKSEIGQNIKDAYLEAKKSANIIVVDWSAGSMQFYTRAKDIVSLVADIVADFVDRLVKENGLDVNDLHIIGHSLGAHVSGLAGARIKAGKPARVTGLDPARPNFEKVKPDERISKASAKYVDIIHTCSNRLGLSEPLGHVDYYPNRGEALQRGCLTDYSGACSHARSFQLYAESIIKPKGFKATLCSEWDKFTYKGCKGNPVLYISDESPAEYTEGSYYLKTEKEPPLALGEESDVFSIEEKKADEEDSILAKMLFSVM